MIDDLTWDAILQTWPWFGAAAGIFVVAVGMLIAVKPRSNAPSKTTDTVADRKDWRLTGRIDFADSQPVAGLVLEVEETQTSISPSGVKHHEFRWRRGTLYEAKMVLESYHAQRNLAMSATFSAPGPVETTQTGNGQGKRIDASEAVADGQDMADVTLVPQDATH
jgi:hypothetical protein